MGLRAKALQEDIYEKDPWQMLFAKGPSHEENGYGTDDRR